MSNEIEKYNKMLKEEYGENITVEIKNNTDDDGNEYYYYISAYKGDSESFETVREAYDYACMYLECLGF